MPFVASTGFPWFLMLNTGSYVLVDLHMLTPVTNLNRVELVKMDEDTIADSLV